MAGIGFELRKFLRQDSYLGLLKAYGYAGIIGSGPWLLSILGVLVIGVVSVALQADALEVIQFLISVTYLMAGSLLISSWLQLMLTRFIADRLFENRPQEVLPNLFGALLVTTLSSAAVGLLFEPLFAEQRLSYRLLMWVNLITLSDIWVLVIISSGLRSHRRVLGAFLFGYGSMIIAALALVDYGLPGLLIGLFVGHALLLFSLLSMVVLHYPAERLITFEFLSPSKSLYSLALVGVIYNVGIWSDKALFWFNSATSEAIIGPLRSSIIYDPPVFLAYLSVIPGMAVFLLRMEADFVDCYHDYYDRIRNGGSLISIQQAKQRMVNSVRRGFYEVAKVQGMFALILILFAESVVSWFGISPLYFLLFSIDVVAVAVQVLLLAIFNVFFYLDKRSMALLLTSFFSVTNILFTLFSQQLGVAFYGYGFAASVGFTAVLGLGLLNRTLLQLEYETFMLQR